MRNRGAGGIPHRWLAGGRDADRAGPFADSLLCGLGRELHAAARVPLGATKFALPAAAAAPASGGGNHTVVLAVVGAHLSGLPLNHEIVSRGARLLGAARTTAQYRLYALPHTTPPIECLAQVHIPDPERRYAAYPFELSGGMCQRVMIALALACNPALLIADEPTTGLDVTMQAAVMDLIGELSQSRHMATILITHDLGLAAEYCGRIIVMHAGHVVESAPAADLFRAPRHPYTRKLVLASPHGRIRIDELESVPGGLPDLRRADLPPCRFSARCERRSEVCERLPLPHHACASGSNVWCHHPL